jgi:hypothetical protein
LYTNYAFIFLERGVAMWKKKGFVNVCCTTQLENVSSCLPSDELYGAESFLRSLLHFLS